MTAGRQRAGSVKDPNVVEAEKAAQARREAEAKAKVEAERAEKAKRAAELKAALEDEKKRNNGNLTPLPISTESN